MPTLSRRDFARVLAISGSASFLPARAFAQPFVNLGDLGFSSGPLPRTPAEPDEAYWREVRARFLIPKDVAFFNAANLCPMSVPVLEAIEKHMREYEVTPSPQVRSVLMHGREGARKMIANALRCTPEESC